MKEIITNYLINTTRKRRVVYFMKEEPWYILLEEEFIKLDLPAEWNLLRKLWHYWNNTIDIPKCPISGLPRKWRSGNSIERIDLPHMSQGYSLFANNTIATQELYKTARKTLIEKYNVTNPMDIPGISEKRKNYFLEKFGVENPSSNRNVKEKRHKTMISKYGFAHNFENCEEFMLQKYGVRNPSHIPEKAEILCNNRYKKKHDYILETGEIIQLQGFETHGMKYLSKIYGESEVQYRKIHMPAIFYMSDNNQNKRRYYPDFFIKKCNLIVEVKSKYTLMKDFSIAKLKFDSARTTGYNVLLLIFDRYGNLLHESDANNFDIEKL